MYNPPLLEGSSQGYLFIKGGLASEAMSETIQTDVVFLGAVSGAETEDPGGQLFQPSVAGCTIKEAT